MSKCKHKPMMIENLFFPLEHHILHVFVCVCICICIYIYIYIYICMYTHTHTHTYIRCPNHSMKWREKVKHTYIQSYIFVFNVINIIHGFITLIIELGSQLCKLCDKTHHTEEFIMVTQFGSVQLVAQSCLALCDFMACSTPDFPVHHHLPELAQSHVHPVGSAIQPSHPLTSPSPPVFNLF